MGTSRRRRGVVLTAQGLKKLHAARLAVTNRRGERGKATVADLSELSGLDDATVSRVFSRRSGVDRQTIARLFEALDTALDADDFSYAAGESPSTNGAAGNRGTVIVSIELLLQDDRVVSVVARTRARPV